jgi:hypothetical protein
MKYTIADKLDRVNACGAARDWVGGYSSEAKAWKECKRPDWMLWLVGSCAMKTGFSREATDKPCPERSYFARAGAAAMSVYIDVLADNCELKPEDEKLVRILSTRLGDAGQGKWRKVPTSEFAFDHLPPALHALCCSAEDLLNCPAVERGSFIDDLSGDLSGCFERCYEGDELMEATAEEVCNEIRRVCERPSLEWIAKNLRRAAK